MFGCNVMEMFGSVAAMFFPQGNAWSFCDCIIAESHCMLYNWVSISSNSLQFNLSMLTLQLVNWSSRP